MSTGRTIQYFFKTNGCPTLAADDPECICWHDVGTGPFPERELGEYSVPLPHSGFRVKPDYGSGSPMPPCKPPATDKDELINELVGALRNVQGIICDGAMEGFNCLEGDWAERLFFSNQRTSNVLRKATGTNKSTR